MLVDVLRAARRPPGCLYEKWRECSLATRFGLAAIVVLSLSMTIFGAWVTHRIEQGVVSNAAAEAALYIISIIEPRVQELNRKPTLRADSHLSIDALLSDTPLGRKVMAIKVWSEDGIVLYSNFKEHVGQRFPVSKQLKNAWKGQIDAAFRAHDDEDNVRERQLGVPLLEIYTPVRATGSDRIIAVAEFYEAATDLQIELRTARLHSWYAVCFATLAMFSLLFGIVRRGSKTIEAQEEALRERITELSSLLAQNEDLRRRIDEVHRRSLVTNELFLRRVGIELHDGPAQFISLALLRLDSLPLASDSTRAEAQERELKRIQSALAESLSEIRSISAGLALPELDRITADAGLQLAVRNHERRTNTSVQYRFDNFPHLLPAEIKTCLYRFLQEGLNNAFRHAGGIGQTVRATGHDGVIEVEVADAGPGFEPNKTTDDWQHLGLAGMRDRITSLGGSLQVDSGPGAGTRLTARFIVTDSCRRSEVAARSQEATQSEVAAHV